MHLCACVFNSDLGSGEGRQGEAAQGQGPRFGLIYWFGFLCWWCLFLKALAKELVQSRKAVNHLYENKAQLNSISMHLGKIVGNGHPLHRIYLSR